MVGTLCALLQVIVCSAQTHWIFNAIQQSMLRLVLVSTSVCQSGDEGVVEE